MLTTLAIWFAVPAIAGLHRFCCELGYRYAPAGIAARHGLAVAGLLLVVELVLWTLWQ